MGFKDAKRQLLECLTSGNILHEQRNDIDIKNLLATGQISVGDVSDIMGRVRGNCYESSPHHVVSDIEVHIVKTVYQGVHWYIKWYFVEPNSVFISVHN